MASSRKLLDSTHNAGSVAIEYGLILPAMLLFTLGLMDAGRLLWTNITLTRATEAAARCGAVNVATCSTAAAIQTYAVAQAWGLGDVTTSNFTPNAAATCGVQVAANYTFQFLVPWFPQFSASAPFGSTTMTLNPTACYPLQH
jgi:Flp pilus assembly protein TadG